MITPAEIKRKAKRKYRALLRATVAGEEFFPLQIRFRKAKASDDYLALREWVETLTAASKSARGYGYTVELAERNLRRYGRQSLPDQIAIESRSDFLKLIGKEKEFARWETAVTHTLSQFPALKPWLGQQPHRLLPYLDVWADLLAVCAYFVAHPRPGLYIRELPLPVHTKFIEEHQGILRQLLDELLPATAVAAEETHFERRFGLRYDEPLIRLRLLDEALREELGWPAADLSLPLSDCAALRGMNGRSLFIIENKMTFLTLPPLRDGVALWGKGFQAGLLRRIPWLADCPIAYWGDLDAHGFAILSQVRGVFPQTRSLMMDVATLEAFQDFVVKGTAAEAAELSHLTAAETAVYHHLQTHTLRLEQEKISQSYVEKYLAQQIKPDALP